MSIDWMGDRSLNHLLAERVALAPDQTFLVYENRAGEVSELTYGEFDARVEGAAGGLHALGVGPGDRVVVHLRNSPEFLVSWFAISRLAAIMVPSNIANTAGELEHVIGFTEAGFAITEPDFCEVVQRGKPDAAIYRPTLDLLGVPAERVLAVGDALRTDIAGAKAAGLDSCWVLGGIHDFAEGGEGPEGEARAAGLAPIATIPRFVW